ncbi:hypothetical protein SMKI_07G2870 [Saccharomyces mikatae IFO 1815]|uniref:Uncharacterized protein n=1 Tax=Saccharomyces mikatae IFO 1815 TaxID=226126 RepID=A0AA35NGW1_SACMI|nr:uncharacterized protein SMKI_07G2870 [Saccharomyces mikatae IFO 1815]CAI4039304.1 hypothetical protein SMKI_07G2870 [Saccharomyces mikatae IFO 1815]
MAVWALRRDEFTRLSCAKPNTGLKFLILRNEDMTTLRAIAIATILLVVTVNALQANHSCVASLPSNSSGFNKNATGKELVQKVFSRESAGKTSLTHRANELFSIPWDGPAGTVRNFDFTNLGLPDAINLHKSCTDNYHSFTANNTCPNKDFAQRFLGHTLNSTSSNNFSTGFSSNKKKDDGGFLGKNTKFPSLKSLPITRNSCQGFFSFTIFGVNFHVSFNCNQNPIDRHHCEMYCEGCLQDKVGGMYSSV